MGVSSIGGNQKWIVLLGKIPPRNGCLWNSPCVVMVIFLGVLMVIQRGLIGHANTGD